LAFTYTGATVQGVATFDPLAVGEDGLPPGSYEVRLMFDDGYIVLASSLFTVSP
jgi:hypothetical protein